MEYAEKVNLSIQDEITLKKYTRSKAIADRIKLRANILLLSNDEIPNGHIVNLLNINPTTVTLWIHRYFKEGINCILKDRPRGLNHGGKKTVDQQKLREQIIKKTTGSKPKNATHWSTRSMAKELNTTHSFVNRVWQSVGLKPHLEKTFKVSNDKQFEEKLTDVVGLYLNPPENAIVFCVDEKTSIQALDRSQPGLPLKKGRCGTVTHDYKRNGTSTLFAALEVATGKVIGDCYQKHTNKEFLNFIKKVDAQTDSEKELHIIVDNYATHKHENVKKWLVKNSRVKLHFIPTSSSWLNLVERFFAAITQNQLKRGIFTSVKELEEKIMDYIKISNDDPKPFVWTKSVAEILEKVNRARSALDKISED